MERGALDVPADIIAGSLRVMLPSTCRRELSISRSGGEDCGLWWVEGEAALLGLELEVESALSEAEITRLGWRK